MLVIPEGILKFFRDEQTERFEQTTNELFYFDVKVPWVLHTSQQPALYILN